MKKEAVQSIETMRVSSRYNRSSLSIISLSTFVLTGLALTLFTCCGCSQSEGDSVEDSVSSSSDSIAENADSLDVWSSDASNSTGPVKPGRKAGERMVRTINGVEFAFRWCPPGKFMMGAPTSEKGYQKGGKFTTKEFEANDYRDSLGHRIGYVDEVYYDYPLYPETQHEVTLTEGFWIMETEVTRKQWKAITGEEPVYSDTRSSGDDFPIEDILWNQRERRDWMFKTNDGYKFCEKCRQLGLPVNLPTEAQWEYACRAGTKTALNNGKNLTSCEKCRNLDSVAWYFTKNDKYEPHPVGKKKPNAWGIYDMHGNVGELCFDCYGEYPSQSVKNPVNPFRGYKFVIRGGSYRHYAEFCRSASRAICCKGTPAPKMNGYCYSEPSHGIGLRFVILAGPAEYKPAQAPVAVEPIADGTKAGERMVKTVNGIEFAFRWCPAGKFVMGSPKSEQGHKDDETQRNVTLTKGFWMMETEITQKQWFAVMGYNPSYYRNYDYPVEYITWNECQEFCKKSKQLGLPTSLPTETQWEYACRAGTTTALNNGKDILENENDSNLNEVAWNNYNSGREISPVAQKKPNAWGLYDMLGNVSEWCLDKYTCYPNEVSNPEDERGIKRGGNCYSFLDCRSGARTPEFFDIFEQSPNLGIGARFVIAPPVNNAEPTEIVTSVSVEEEFKPAEAAKPAEAPKPAEVPKPAEEAKPVEEATPAEEAKPAEVVKQSDMKAGNGTVIVQDGVKAIDNEAFANCTDLTSITLPKGLTSIGKKAFANCTNLKSITFSEGLTSIDEEAFAGCANLTSITLPQGLTSIGKKAFSNCKNLTSITLPDDMTSIGAEAFAGCANLTSIVLPKGLTSIGEKTFDDCDNLTSITLPKNLAVVKNVDYCGSINNIKSVTLPEGVTSIDRDVFHSRPGTDYRNLRSIILPKGLTSIGDGAFSGLHITSITLPEGLTSIGKSAFGNCYNLTSITLPKGLTSIGEDAFAGSHLESITLPEGLTSIGEGAFSDCNHLTSITLPEGLTSIQRNTFWNANIKSIKLPESLKSIDEGAFHACSELTSITFPKGLTSIGKEAFYFCYNLKSITLSEGLTSIADDAFDRCEKLTSITIAPGNKTFELKKMKFNDCIELIDKTTGKVKFRIWKKAEAAAEEEEEETPAEKAKPAEEATPTKEETPAEEAAPVVETPKYPPQMVVTDGKAAGERMSITINGVAFAFRWCPAGTFTMGETMKSDTRATPHQVTLTKGFWLLETEITQQQWNAVKGTNPSYFKGDNLPVDTVDWNDCQEFCEKCRQLGFPIYLPTEAQWEYACRAGSTGMYAGNLDAMTWYNRNSNRTTHPVGTKMPNAWGVYDMHGNVEEWCADLYQAGYPTGECIDPVGPSKGYAHVIRGGYWAISSLGCSSAKRQTKTPEYKSRLLGFRIAVKGQ